MAIKRSNNKMVAGVIAGIAEEYNIDISLCRLVFAIVLLFTGLLPGIVFYIGGIIIFEKADDVIDDVKKDVRKKDN